MGKRNTGRKLAMQTLYQTEVRKADIETVLDVFMEKAAYLETTKEWSCFLARNTFAKKEELDKIIAQYAIDWDLDRINPLDKSLLRLALYKLKYTDTPLRVVLDEVIEIAKKYSTQDSAKFINGILGKYISD